MIQALKNSKSNQTDVNVSKGITFQLPFAGIFPSALQLLWYPITPSSQTKICPTTDSAVVNIYFKQTLILLAPGSAEISSCFILSRYAK